MSVLETAGACDSIFTLPEILSCVGLSHGPALELEARLAAARDVEGFQVERVAAKRRKLQTSKEQQSNKGVHIRDLQDRSKHRVRTRLSLELPCILCIIRLPFWHGHQSDMATNHLDVRQMLERT